MAHMHNGGRGTPRVDLTAMVDLGFLLITFFMLATTMQQNKAMAVHMPADTGEHSFVMRSKTLTILLGEEGKVFWYVGVGGEETVAFDSTDFSANGIRKVIMRRQKEVEEMYRTPGNATLIVLVKSMKTAPYRSLTAMLDEIDVTNTERYSIVKTDESDAYIMRQVGQSTEEATEILDTPNE